MILALLEGYPLLSVALHLMRSFLQGQDQMRIIKQRLMEMIPGLSIFLDVDGQSVEDTLDIERSSITQAHLACSHTESLYVLLCQIWKI